MVVGSSTVAVNYHVCFFFVGQVSKNLLPHQPIFLILTAKIASFILVHPMKLASFYGHISNHVSYYLLSATR